MTNHKDTYRIKWWKSQQFYFLQVSSGCDLSQNNHSIFYTHTLSLSFLSHTYTQMAGNNKHFFIHFPKIMDSVTPFGHPSPSLSHLTTTRSLTLVVNEDKAAISLPEERGGAKGGEKKSPGNMKHDTGNNSRKVPGYSLIDRGDNSLYSQPRRWTCGWKEGYFPEILHFTPPYWHTLEYSLWVDTDTLQACVSVVYCEHVYRSLLACSSINFCFYVLKISERLLQLKTWSNRIFTDLFFAWNEKIFSKNLIEG